MAVLMEKVKKVFIFKMCSHLYYKRESLDVDIVMWTCVTVLFHEKSAYNIFWVESSKYLYNNS